MHPKLDQLTNSAGVAVGDAFLVVIPLTSSLRDREESRRRPVGRATGTSAMLPVPGMLPAKLFGRMLKGQSAHDMGMHTQMYLGLAATEVVWLHRRLWKGRWLEHYRESLHDLVFEVETDPLMNNNRVLVGNDAWWAKRDHIDDLMHALSLVAHELPDSG